MNQLLEDGEDEILKMGDKENIEYQDYGIESIKDASYKNFGMQSTSIIRLKYWSNFVIET